MGPSSASGSLYDTPAAYSLTQTNGTSPASDLKGPTWFPNPSNWQAKDVAYDEPSQPVHPTPPNWQAKAVAYDEPSQPVHPTPPNRQAKAVAYDEPSQPVRPAPPNWQAKAVAYDEPSQPVRWRGWRGTGRSAGYGMRAA